MDFSGDEPLRRPTTTSHTFQMPPATNTRSSDGYQEKLDALTAQFNMNPSPIDDSEVGE